jgi:hypothetical protein
MAKDQACGATLANLETTIVTGDVPDKTNDNLFSASLIRLLKKNAMVMTFLKNKTRQ